MNDELEMIGKEAVVAYSKYYSGINCEELRKSTKNLRRTGVLAENRTDTFRVCV
jgi:hypothetical protein